MKFLLDTNILSEMRKPRPHGAVLAWFRAYPDAAFGIPAVALFEIQMGIEKLRQQDSARSAAFDFWVGRIAGGGNIVPFDGTAAREAARLLNRHSMGLLADAMIAATAKVNGLAVATRNTRDFEHFAVPLVNPFLFRKG